MSTFTPSASTTRLLFSTTGGNPAVPISATWNNAATTFTGIRFDVTDTASNAASLLMDLRVGGSTQFAVRKDGFVYGKSSTGAGIWIGRTVAAANSVILYGTSADWMLEAFSNISVNINSIAPIGWTSSLYGSQDLSLFRDAADTLAQRRGVNAQAFRIYNTFTDASNYERGFVRWNANVLQIGAEAAGTGVSRDVQFWGYGRRIMTLTDSATVAAHIVGQGLTAPATPTGTLTVSTLTNSVDRTGLDIAWTDGSGSRQGGFRFRDTQVPGDWVACEMEMRQSTGSGNVIVSKLGAQNASWPGTSFVSSDTADNPLTTSPTFQWRNATTVQLTIDQNNNIVANNAAVATNATNGFFYVAGCAGTPTGAPTAYTGRVPIVVDTTNHKLYFYSGGSWRDAGP
jgi:hypothetical protein